MKLTRGHMRLILTAAIGLALGPSVVADLQFYSSNPTTPLIESGRPASTFVAPDTDVGIAAAMRAQSAVAARWHVTVPIVSHRDVVERPCGAIKKAYKRKHLVLLGNMMNNDAILHLYAQYYASCDAQYPGPGGSIVRTVTDPWGHRTNCIIVGGSDAQGLQRAVDVFIQHVQSAPQPRLPRLMSLRPTGRIADLIAADGAGDAAEYAAGIRARLNPEGKHQPLHIQQVLSISGSEGRQYYWTGLEGHLLVFRAALEELQKWDLHDAHAAEFFLKDLVRAWDLVEDHPSFDDGRRRRVIEYLYRMGCSVERDYWFTTPERARGRAHFTTNHVSNGTLGALALGTYLQRYCRPGSPEAKRVGRWLAGTHRLFRRQARGYKPGCDSQGYQWWTVEHMTEYALWTGDLTYFRNGNCALACDLGILTIDNLGHGAAFGDRPDPRTDQPMLKRVLRKSARVSGIPRHAWWAERKLTSFRDNYRIMASGASQYATGFRQTEPTDFLGVVAAPQSFAYYQENAKRTRPFRSTMSRYGTLLSSLPYLKTFDKISYRSGFGEDDPYLLLDGLAGLPHGQTDGNVLTQLTALGEVFLIDADYVRKAMWDHNGVYICRDGETGPVPYTVALEDIYNGPDLGYTHTVLYDDNGLDWHRHVLWERGGTFFVADELECRQAGEYATCCTWRNLTESALEGDTWVCQQGDATFRLHCADAGTTRSAYEDLDYRLGTRAWVLRQMKSASMEPGDTLSYVNLFYAQYSAAPPAEVFGSPGAAGITGPDSRASRHLALLRAGNDLRVPTDARLAYVAPERALFAGMKRLRLPGLVLTTDRPVVVVLDLATGNTEIVSRFPVRLRWNGQADSTRGPGMDRVRAGTPTVQSFSRPCRLRRRAPDAAVRYLRDLRWQPEIRPGTVSGAPRPQPSGPQPKVLWSFDGFDVSAPALTGIQVRIVDEANTVGTAERLVDGGSRTSTVSVRWPKGAEAQVQLDFGAAVRLDRLRIRTFWMRQDAYEWRLEPVDTAGKRRTIATSPTMVGPYTPRGNVNTVYEYRGLDTEATGVILRIRPKDPEGYVYLAELEAFPAPTEADRRRVEIKDMVQADDGSGRLFVGASDGWLRCLDGATGHQQWELDAGTKVTDVATADLDADGVHEALAATFGSRALVADANGEVLWDKQLDRPGGVVFPANLGSLGNPAVIVGCYYWYYAFDAEGRQLWRNRIYAHSATEGVAADLDGDGMDEIIGGAEFRSFNVIASDGGKSIVQRTFDGPDLKLLAADLDPGEGQEIAVGNNAGFGVFRADTKPIWTVTTQCPVPGLATPDLDGDGHADVLAGAENGFVYAHAGDGRRLWRCLTPAPVADLAAADIDGDGVLEIVVAGRDGALRLLDTRGQALGTVPLPHAPHRLLACQLDAGAASEIVVGMGGEVTALAWDAPLPEAAAEP